MQGRRGASTLVRWALPLGPVGWCRAERRGKPQGAEAASVLPGTHGGPCSPWWGPVVRREGSGAEGDGEEMQAGLCPVLVCCAGPAHSPACLHKPVWLPSPLSSDAGFHDWGPTSSVALGLGRGQEGSGNGLRPTASLSESLEQLGDEAQAGLRAPMFLFSMRGFFFNFMGV